MAANRRAVRLGVMPDCATEALRGVDRYVVGRSTPGHRASFRRVAGSAMLNQERLAMLDVLDLSAGGRRRWMASDLVENSRYRCQDDTASGAVS
jgi:hypothetical protein